MQKVGLTEIVQRCLSVTGSVQMVPRKLILLAVAALICFASLIEVSPALAQGELLTNGGFDADTSGWHAWRVSLGWEDGAARLVTSQGMASGSMYQDVAVQGEGSYAVAGRVKLNDSHISAVKLYLRWFSQGGEIIGEVVFGCATGASLDYQQFGGVHMAPPAAATARVEAAAIPLDPVPGTVYLDSFSLVGIAPAPPAQTPVPSPVPVTDPPATPQAPSPPPATLSPAPAPMAEPETPYPPELPAAGEHPWPAFTWPALALIAGAALAGGLWLARRREIRGP